MDREEMRFQVALACWKIGESQEIAVTRANVFMDYFDKSRPDYQDPAKLEETVQARVKEAVERDRSRLVDLLSRGRGLQVPNGSELMLCPDSPGHWLRMRPEDALKFVMTGVPRG